MLKKLLSVLILACMVLHCSSRLGVLSVLYQNRYEIMVALKVINEKPIPLCDRHYFARRHLVTVTDDQGANRYLAMAQEIILFSPAVRLIPTDRLPDGLWPHTSLKSPSPYSSPHLEIFHPPMS